MNAATAYAAPTKKPRRGRVAPAKTAREADARWGFADRAWRGELDAYTAEHFVQDARAGVVEPIVVVAPVARACPRQRPENDCKPREFPSYYRTAWTQRTPARVRRRAVAPVVSGALIRAVRPPASGSRAWREAALYRGRREPAPVATPVVEPETRLARRTIRRPTICFDCKCWLEHVARLEFARRHGDELSRADVPRLADAGAVLRALHEQAHRDYAFLLPILGELPLDLREPLDWKRIVDLAAEIRETIAAGDDVDVGAVRLRFQA